MGFLGAYRIPTSSPPTLVVGNTTVGNNTTPTQINLDPYVSNTLVLWNNYNSTVFVVLSAGFRPRGVSSELSPPLSY